MQEHEKEAKVNALILHSFLELQRQGPHQINHGKEDKTNGEYGSRSPDGYRSDRDDTVKDGRFLGTPDRRGYGHMYYSSSSSGKGYGHHRYHPYKRSERACFPYYFNNSKPTIFDGEVNKTQDEKAWFLGMNKLLVFHDYSEKMKARIASFHLKGKPNI